MDLIPPPFLPEDLPLGQKQELFAQLWSTFLAWFHLHPTWRMRFAEGYVGDTDGADGDHDGPHMEGGAHYHKLAQDFDFFLVEMGSSRLHLDKDHPFWHECGEFWLSLHPFCRWGGHFKVKDYDHFSLEHNGVQ